MNRTEKILFAFGVVEAALVLGAYAVLLAITGNPRYGAYGAAGIQLPFVPIITIAAVRNDPNLGIANAMGAVWAAALFGLALAYTPVPSKMTQPDLPAFFLCLYAGVLIVSNLFFLGIGNILKRHAHEREVGAPEVRIEYVSPAISIPAVGILAALILIPLLSKRPAVAYAFAIALLPFGLIALQHLRRLLKPVPSANR